MSSFESIRIRRRPTLKKKGCNFMGGVGSPILSNIYLDRLDRFVENTLIPAYVRGKERKENPAYEHIRSQARYQWKKGNTERGNQIRREMETGVKSPGLSSPCTMK